MSELSEQYAQITDKLVAADLRPTRQRLLLGSLLFTGSCRHVTAEALYKEAESAGMDVSLATVYNTLHQFTSANLLREVNVEGNCSYFDTNVDAHHHFLCEESGELTDIPHDHITLHAIPTPPKGSKIASVDVVIKLRKEA